MKRPVMIVTLMWLMLCSISPLANAQASATPTLHQRHVINEQKQKLNMYVTGPSTVADTCGVTLKAMVDWTSFINAGMLEKSVPGTEGPAAFCARPLDAIAEMCGSNAGSDAAANKSAIANKIKAYHCVYTPDKQQDLSLDSSGTLTYSGNYSAQKAEPFTAAWLGKNL